MAVDSLLLSMAERGETGFALRTYLWEPACVSIGRLQDPSREICAERLRAGGIGADASHALVRTRIEGGQQ